MILLEDLAGFVTTGDVLSARQTRILSTPCHGDDSGETLTVSSLPFSACLESIRIARSFPSRASNSS